MELEEIERLASKAYVELVQVKMSLYVVTRLVRESLMRQGMSQEELESIVQKVAIEAKEFVDHQDQEDGEA